MKNTKTLDASPEAQRPCVLEGDFGQFPIGIMAQHPEAAPFMDELNRIHSLVSGLGVVMRIVVGNGVLKDFYVPGTKTEPPLSSSAIGRLELMAAAICEIVEENIDATAMRYKTRGDA